MRMKRSVLDLLREQIGRDSIPAPASDELRWDWLEYFILPLPDLLELTGMPKGRFESYMRRRLVDIDRFGQGAGNHARYKPIEALKLMAIDGLAKAGAWDECLYHAFRHHGTFEGIVYDYQAHKFPGRGRPDSISMNTQQDRWFIENPDRPTPARSDMTKEFHIPAWNAWPPRQEWPPREWYRLEFDAATFIEITVPKIIAFLERKGVSVQDR